MNPFLICLLALLLACPAQAAQDTTWPDWDHFRSAFISADGRVIDPVLGVTTSEGQSYALLFSLVANDGAAFERILSWSAANLAHGDLTAQLPAWQWGLRPDGQWGVMDNNAAADADLWMAYALSEAGRLWKKPRYTALAQLLAERILREETRQLPGLGRTLLPGPAGFQTSPSSWRLNPSYMPIQILRRLSSLYPDAGWNQLITTSLEVINRSAPKGFAPEWIDYQAGGEFRANPPVGSYNAIRVYLWAGMLNKQDPASSLLLKKLAPMGRHLNQEGTPPVEVNTENGTVQGSGSAGFSAALLPFLKASGMTGALRRQQLRVTALAPLARTDNYYDQVLTLFGQGWIEGRYEFMRDGALKPGWLCIKN